MRKRKAVPLPRRERSFRDKLLKKPRGLLWCEDVLSVSLAEDLCEPLERLSSASSDVMVPLMEEARVDVTA